MRKSIFNVVGITWRCIYPFEKKRKKESIWRNDIVKMSQEGDEVFLAEYEYEGKKAFAVVNKRIGKDIGVIEASDVRYVTRLEGVIESIEKEDGYYHILVRLEG